MKLLVCTQVLDKNHPILGFFHGWVIEFAKHAEVVQVICLEKGYYELPDNVFVHSLGKEAGKSRLTYLWRFYTIFGKLFFTRHIDHVFYHMGAIYNIVGAPFFLLRKLFGVKFYWWKAHGTINVFGRSAGAFADVIVTSTESGFPYWKKKRRVVGQAIDSALFSNHNEVRNERQILYVGRLTPVKNLELFAQVAAVLRPYGYTFLVIGPIDVVDPDYSTALVSTLTAAGVVYGGTVMHSELPKLYEQSGFFLNTSKTNSMDKTVLEAMLCGCIPVTANVAFKNILQPFELLLATHDAPLYAALIRLKTDHPDATLRQALRAAVVAEHSIGTLYTRIFL